MLSSQALPFYTSAVAHIINITEQSYSSCCGQHRQGVAKRAGGGGRGKVGGRRVQGARRTESRRGGAQLVAL